MNNQIKQRATSTLSDGKSLSALDCSDQNNSGVGIPQYMKPTLICYGDVRDITLGPSPGFGESGCECDRRPGGSLDCPVPPSPCFP